MLVIKFDFLETAPQSQFLTYKATFNVCDKFNRCLHQKTWPHRKGGYIRFRDQGAQHDYMFSCILINTVNVWLELLG
jgi:hypothetical protein